MENIYSKNYKRIMETLLLRDLGTYYQIYIMFNSSARKKAFSKDNKVSRLVELEKVYVKCRQQRISEQITAS